ncbi:MAG: deoxyribose-phosphate aldolase [Abditibacteriales bacterium]|nr:deoxyribose-phosphate aldolase [Abditibacteriales bacterium]MDW8367310.1 deoxyribose-phosphate aldolase [Abditibacteriales bacterium]
MNPEQLAQLIDHTNLKPDATEDDIRRLCAEAKRFLFAAVCVHPVYVSLATTLLADSPVQVASVVGFPLGANETNTKAYETKRAIIAGANEIDMVLPIGALKGGKHDVVLNDIRAVVQAAQGAVVKVIIEACLLTDEEKVRACQIAREAGAHFVKTSTGFGAHGARVEDVRLMRQTVGDALGVKAAGGIRTYAQALAMVQAGASRLGTSGSVKIMEESVMSPTRRAWAIPTTFPDETHSHTS